MKGINEALTWSGSGVTLSMFIVLRPNAAPTIELPQGNSRLQEIRLYDLEDVKDVLGGRRVIEYDTQFAKVPSDLEAFLSLCLRQAMTQGAEVAWFGFEGSFDFEFLLSPEIAPQIYAVADADGVSIAADDTLGSEVWRERIAQARRRLLSWE